MPSGHPLGSLVFLRPDRWFMLTPQGWHEGSPGATDQLNLRLGGDIYPATSLNPRLNRPGIFCDLMLGKRFQDAPWPALEGAPTIRL